MWNSSPTQLLKAIVVEGVATKVEVLSKTLRGKRLSVYKQPSACGIFHLRFRLLTGFAALLNSVQVRRFEFDGRLLYLGPSKSPVALTISAGNDFSFTLGLDQYTTDMVARLNAESFDNSVCMLEVMLEVLDAGVPIFNS